ncbi:MAG TPA: lysophospholipid acyltransferase family protein [Chloroflexota bacterium]|nr:lysophospholipid acyltransferase family protein [Chloroflexota bacterium]
MEQNLQIALAGKPQAEIDSIAWSNFRNHAKAYIDLMRLPSAKVADLRQLLKVEGADNLDAALARGRGVLVISAHVGSWEVVAAIWAATIAPVCLFAEELEPREMFEWYRNTRQRLGISVLPLSLGGLRQVVKALQDKEMVVTAVDRDLIGNGIMVDFFGHPARIPTGPAALSLRLGTPILPVAVHRLPDDTYEARGYPPILLQPSGDHEKDVRLVTEQLVRALEEIIRSHPEQWHLPHKIWEGSDFP